MTEMNMADILWRLAKLETENQRIRKTVPVIRKWLMNDLPCPDDTTIDAMWELCEAVGSGWKEDEEDGEKDEG